jgi:hypothetical protein
MPSTERAKRERKAGFRVGLWEVQIYGPRSETRRSSRAKRQWQKKLFILILALALLVAWHIDPSAVIVLLIALNLVRELLAALTL